MQSFILNGGTVQSRKEYLENLVTAQVEIIHLFAEKSSITIKQIQDLQGPLAISPRLERIVWIEEANLMTIPAQNALLKMLEEPPERTTFYLTCMSHSSLLTTVLSRSRTIVLTKDTINPDPAVLADLKDVMSLSAGDRLVNIVKRDRAESIVWVTQIEQALADKLKDSHISASGAAMLAKIAKLALSMHSQLAANCSVSLSTQNFYLTLPHTRSIS